MSVGIDRIAVPIAVVLALMSSVAEAQVIDHPTTFTGQTDLTFTNNASVTAGGNAQLTPAVNNNRGSFWTNAQLPVDKFVARFTFHELGTAGSEADGIGFCLQRVGTSAIGAGGGLMGYQGILTSIFVKFDNYNNESSTGLYTNGADPSPNSIDMRASGVDIHSQHDFRVDMSYNGATIAMTVRDLTTNSTFTQNFTVDIPTTIGGATAFVGFTGATGGLNANQEVLNLVYVTAPTGLAATNQTNQVTLNWNAVTGAPTYNVYRGTTSGGPYPTQVATGVAGTNYVDNTALWPNSYYYVVRAVVSTVEGPNSNQATGTPLPPPVSVSPTSIQTSENGSTANLTLTVNVSPAADGTVQVTSSLPSQALVSGQGQGPASTITINVPSGTLAGTTYTVTVTGQHDFIDNGNQNYTISFVVGGGGAPWTGTTIPPVSGTNLDIDTASLLVTPTAGLQTNTNGGFDTFDVRLNSRPVNPVTISVTSSDTTEATVSTSLLTFDSTNWDQVQTVIVTGQGINITYVNTPFTITLAVQNGSDSAYLGMTATVTGVNIHLEAPPTLDKVWGCGLAGAEVLIPLGLLAFWRRRRRD